MPQYRYVAIEPPSERVEGHMQAASKSAVVERLHAQGHVPIHVDQLGRLFAADLDFAGLLHRRLSSRSLSLITGQLATLLHAGLALDEALRIMDELVDRPSERQCLQALLKKISGGATLADAMAAQPAAFPNFYISMIRAGEAGGSLEAVLDRLAEFLDRSQAAKEHIRSALLYPLIVALTCCASILVLFTVVVPRFRPLFEQAGGALPPAARTLLSISNLVEAYWWLGVIGVVMIAAALVMQFKHPASRRRWESWLLKVPALGKLITKMEVARFSRTLGTLLKNGVSLLSALAITRETIRNRVFLEAVATVIDRVKTGKGLAEPLMQTRVFPSLAVHLVRVGEESGRQEEMLFKIADIFEAETRRNVDRVLDLLGPALTIGLGLIVAAVIGSILTAVLSVYDLTM